MLSEKRFVLFYVLSFPAGVYVGTLNLIVSIPDPSILTLDGILDFATGITHRLIEDLTHSLASTTAKKITSITQEVRCIFFTSVLRLFQDYFSSYETGQSVGGRKRENPEKIHLAHPQAEFGWPVRGSNPHQTQRCGIKHQLPNCL